MTNLTNKRKKILLIEMSKILNKDLVSHQRLYSDILIDDILFSWTKLTYKDLIEWKDGIENSFFLWLEGGHIKKILFSSTRAALGVSFQKGIDPPLAISSCGI